MKRWDGIFHINAIKFHPTCLLMVWKVGWFAPYKQVLRPPNVLQRKRVSFTRTPKKKSCNWQLGTSIRNAMRYVASLMRCHTDLFVCLASISSPWGILQEGLFAEYFLMQSHWCPSQITLLVFRLFESFRPRSTFSRLRVSFKGFSCGFFLMQSHQLS